MLNNNKRGGFTLVEITVTVVILGILAGIAYPLFSSALAKSRRKDCKNQCVVMSGYVEQIMAGFEDSGAMQNTIPSIPGLGSGKHRVCLDEDGRDLPFGSEQSTDRQGKPLVRFEKHYDRDNDLACDFCGADTTVPLVDYENVGNHLNKKHLIRFDYDTGKVTSLTDEEAEEAGIDLGNVSDWYLSVSSATVSDIRGGYSAEGNYDERCEQGYYLKKQSVGDTTLLSLFAHGELPVCPFDSEKQYGYFITFDGKVHCSCPECY